MDFRKRSYFHVPGIMIEYEKACHEAGVQEIIHINHVFVQKVNKKGGLRLY